MKNSVKQKLTKSLTGFFLVGCMALLAISLTRCGTKKDDTATTISPTYSSLYANIFSQNCVVCHKPGGSATSIRNTTIDFSTAASGYSTLVPGVVSGSSSPSCANISITVASSPQNSYLLAVLSSTYYRSNIGKPGCTPYATHGSDTNVKPEELNAMVTWINGGALNN